MAWMDAGVTERWYQTGTLQTVDSGLESRWSRCGELDAGFPAVWPVSGAVGMRWATARSPAITVKISGMPVVGREAEMHEPPPWEACSRRRSSAARRRCPAWSGMGVMDGLVSVLQPDDAAP